MLKNTFTLQVSFVLVLTTLLFIAYLPGITGALYYDDYGNLNGLNEINSFSAALDFIYGGTSGPLGRPLSLLTFIPHYSEWPNNSVSILLVNIIIHCINFILLGLITKNILSELKITKSEVHYISWVSAFLWAILPIIASTSLIAIQRMTLLSFSFGLVGLFFYTLLNRTFVAKPVSTAVVQVSVIVVFTTLAIFTKESAAIIPALALLIECFFFNKNRVHRKIWLGKVLILSIPLIYILYYLSPLNMDWFSVNSYREFSPIERLQTQITILLSYVQHGLLPQSPTFFGPFHDYYGINSDLNVFIKSTVVWFLVILISLYLTKFSKLPLFGLVWFFSCHLIESTTVSLELYFEHRNYVAFYGIILALVYHVWIYKSKRISFEVILKVLLLLYIVTVWLILFAVTSLWGDPSKAAESWNVRHPGSARAALHVVNLEMQNSEVTESKEYWAMSLLDRTSKACPDCFDSRLISFIYSCKLTNDEDSLNRFNEILQLAETAPINQNITENLFSLHEITSKNSCGAIDSEKFIILVDKILNNKNTHSRLFGPRVLFVKAMIFESKNDYDKSLAVLDEAESIDPSAVPILEYQLYIHKLRNDKKSYYQAIQRRKGHLFDIQILENFEKKLIEFE